MLLTDNPIRGSSEDEYGFQDHANVLCDALTNTRDLPITIGVFGPWGSGKSSFLNICQELLADKGMTVVSFSPWKYDQRDEVWHALLQTLLQKVSEELDRRAAEQSQEPAAMERFREAASRVGRMSLSASWLLARQLIPITALNMLPIPGLISPSDLDGFKEVLSGRSQPPDDDDSALSGPSAIYGPVNQFEQDFSAAVDVLTDNRGPLVVLVDDLDRCRRETALSVLESLRIFTGHARCIFILAMDQTTLVDAAAVHFDGDRTRSRWYLEKLVQFSYHLPAARYESLCVSLRPKVTFLQQDPVLWEVVKVGFGNNPRRVRRFVNSLNLTMATLTRAGDQSLERIRQIAILLMLRQEFPDCFAALHTDPAVWSRLVETDTDGAAVSTLSASDRELAAKDPRLVDTLRAVTGARSGFAFPPPPSADLVQLLTEVLVLGQLATGRGTR